MKPPIPNVPLEIVFAAKMLFYVFLLACFLYVFGSPRGDPLP
jgi:hypothetical protein